MTCGVKIKRRLHPKKKHGDLQVPTLGIYYVIRLNMKIITVILCFRISIFGLKLINIHRYYIKVYIALLYLILGLFFTILGGSCCNVVEASSRVYYADIQSCGPLILLSSPLATKMHNNCSRFINRLFFRGN